MTGMRTNQARLLAGIFFLAVVLSGCAAIQTRQLLETPPEKLPVNHEIINVPFFAQEAYQCGPASLAMVLNYAGFSVMPDALTDQVYIPARQGSMQVEMLAAARRNGALAYELAPQISDLLAEVAAGNPVLVLQNLAFNWHPRWHYAVVVGYDLPLGEIMLRSGLEARQVLSLSTFEHTWARSGYWAMLAMPPEKIPVTATENYYVRAAAALERSAAKKSAFVAYRSALARWPSNLIALMGAGNSAYIRHDLAAAEGFFRAAVSHHPNVGDAWNNLAQALADLSRFDEALAAAHKAIALGGPNAAEYRHTLDGIQRTAHLPR
jgi:tetratricopeptide (TPR) repeat protein